MGFSRGLAALGQRRLGQIVGFVVNDPRLHADRADVCSKQSSDLVDAVINYELIGN